LKNDYILEDLKVDPVEKEHNIKKWLNHVNKMEDIGYPKQLLDSRPIGRRIPVRIQSWDRNRSFIGLTNRKKKKKKKKKCGE
jgi:hypothetical protein